MNFHKKILYGLFLLPTIGFSQSQIPLISGKAKFSVAQGTIECDIVLSEYTFIQDYEIRLNSGLNILNIQSIEPTDFIIAYDRSFKESVQTNETNSYHFTSEDRVSKFLPTKLRFRYVGKFPIVNDTLGNEYTYGDWRGNIAINNQILRADGAQSSWFPVLYDVKNDFAFTEVRYDLEIECTDCEKIYINGNAPVHAPKAHLKSDIPREPFILMGKYTIQETKSMRLLNTDFTQTELDEFEKLNTEILSFLKNYTQKEFNEKITWVQGNNTSKNHAFSFVSYPTFTTVGYPPYDLRSLFKESYKGGYVQIIAHELAHYYFGVLKKHNSTLENLINEGFAEFLSLKYLESIGKQKLAAQLVQFKLDAINDKEFALKPIGTFQDLSHTNDRQTYGYDYQTLVLLSIEKEIGTEKMQKWIALILNESTPTSDFTFLKKTLKEAIQNEKLYNRILTTYLLSNRSVQNINKTIK